MRASIAALCVLIRLGIVPSVPAQTAGGTSPGDPVQPSVADGGTTERPSGGPTRTSEGTGGRVVPVRRDVAGDPAERLILELLSPAGSAEIGGRATSLLELVAASPDPVQQDQTVRAYWNLAIAVADHHRARELLRRNEALAGRPSVSGTSERIIAAASARARADVEATLLAVREAQFALLQRQPSRLPADLPLPEDRPHVGAYRTYFDRFFGSAASFRARQLHEMLPQHQDLIQARAAAVMANRDLLDDAAASAGASVAEVLALHQMLASEYGGFLDAVRGYNLAIAEYARLVSPGATDPRQFVSMLVKTEPERLSADVAGRARPLDGDGLMSVLTDRSGLANSGASSGVVPATAEAPVEDDDWKSQAPAKRRDGFVPRQPDRQ